MERTVKSGGNKDVIPGLRSREAKSALQAAVTVLNGTWTH